MAIAMTCPGCRKAYRLKDELAGKTVKCGNPDCRHPFVVPGARVPAAVTVDADAVAARALAEEHADAAPADARTVAMACEICEHKWAEPWDKQGKNVLCPDCRHRQKVPEQKANKPVDWRQARGGPTLARQQQLDGVVSSGDAGYVSGESLRGAGLGRPELEPRPLWQKVAVVAVPLAVVAVVALGVTSFRSGRAEANVEGAMRLALEDLPDPAGDALPKPEAGLARAAVLVSAGEFFARREKEGDKALPEAVQTLARARQELDGLPNSTGREYLFGELVAAQLLLGGSAEQVNTLQRIRWVPQATGAQRARVSEKVYDVQSELRQTFERMNAADKSVSLDSRLAALRAAARGFAANGHPDAAERLVPVLFADADQVDGLAHAGMAAFRATPAADRAAATVAGAGLGPTRPATPALIALAQVAAPPPADLKLPSVGNPLDDAARLANGLAAVLQNRPAEAIELARRPGRLEARGRLLYLAAELSDDPAPAVQAADEVIKGDIGKPDAGTVPDIVLVRLAGLAGRANLPAAVESLAKMTAKPDGAALAFADGKAHLWRAAGQPVPDAAAGYPAETREVRLGHLLARLAQIRASAAAGEIRPATAFDGWGKGGGRPFGLAGLALGQQDRAGR